YSKKAIPHDEIIASHSGQFRWRKCPYQAKVMKVLETMRRRIVLIRARRGAWLRALSTILLVSTVRFVSTFHSVQPFSFNESIARTRSRASLQLRFGKSIP